MLDRAECVSTCVGSRRLLFNFVWVLQSLFQLVLGLAELVLAYVGSRNFVQLVVDFAEFGPAYVRSRRVLFILF